MLNELSVAQAVVLVPAVTVGTGLKLIFLFVEA